MFQYCSSVDCGSFSYRDAEMSMKVKDELRLDAISSSDLNIITVLMHNAVKFGPDVKPPERIT
jgi:hypothetical protein